MGAKTSNNFKTFLNEDLTKYKGKWIAIKDGEVVLSSEDEEELRRAAAEELEGEYTVTHIVEGDHALVV